MALRELVAARGKHHGKMRELGHVNAERLVEENLWRRVDHVVAPTRYEGDLHRDVVDDGAEIVERNTVRAQDHKILQLEIWRHDLAEHFVDVRDGSSSFGFEADDVR